MTSKDDYVIDNINISPFIATLLFIIAVVMGHLYRKSWKNEEPIWKLWLYGGISGLLLMVVAFIPMAT